MNDIVTRFEQNPLLSLMDLVSSREALMTKPGVVIYERMMWLVVRVAEHPEQNRFSVSSPCQRRMEQQKLKIHSLTMVCKPPNKIAIFENSSSLNIHDIHTNDNLIV